MQGCSKSHVHDKLTLVALSKGEMTLHIKENNLLLKEKKLALINPYQIHSASKKDENSEGLYALYIDKDWVQKLQFELFCSDEYLLFPEVFIENSSTYTDFMKLCKNLLEDEFYIKKEEEIVEFISTLMLENYNEKSLFTTSILFCDIKLYIDKNIGLNLSLEEISNQFLITPFHLIRIFKKELELTPYQYILNQKVNFAKELLLENLSISEVAISAGFNDQSHLYKYFKKIFSYSPKEYQDSFIK